MSTTGTFLGRDAELGALEAALGEARRGRGRLFLLVGEPGIGKTRLADELCARAGDDARVLWGRSWEAGGAPAYWPWIEALRPLLAERSPTELADELGPAAVALAVLMPELRQRLPGLPATPPEDSESARFLLFDALARLLRTSAARTPLVLVLDDLHVADRPSLRLLEFVARGLRGTRALLIGTYRDADARLVPEVASLLATIEREGQRLPLRRLATDEVAAFITSLAGAPADGQVVQAVVRATEGTPLFVTEVLRAVTPQELRGESALPARALLPDGVQPAIRGHLARVSDEARAVLRVASVLGREFTGRALATACDGEVDAPLAEAAHAGLIHDLQDQPPRYRFSHMLVRETVYRDLGAAERARLHGVVARALESNGHSSLAELSHHFSLAGPAGDLTRAVRYGRLAGEQALRSYAHEEAAAHFQRALDAQGADDDRTRGELLLLLAEAHQRTGDRARGRAACEQAAACARRLGDPELLGRAGLRLGAELTPSFVDQTLVTILDEALRQLPSEETPLRARLMARLAAARQPAPVPDEPLDLAKQAMEMARRLGHRPTLAAVLRDARAAYLPLDDVDERLTLDLETLALAYETGDMAAALQALWRVAGERLEQGNFTAALDHLEQYERLATELRQPHRRWSGLLARAGVASATGQFAEADRLLDEAAAAAQTSQDPNARTLLVMARLTHITTATRDDERRSLAARLEEALASRGAPDSRIILSTVRGMTAQGEELQRRADEISLPSHHPRFNGQQYVAEVFLRAGRMETVRLLYERLRPVASRFANIGMVDRCHAHVLARLAAALGLREEAARLFQQAIALHDGAGALPWAADSRMAYAEFLDGTPHAERLRGEARSIAEALGMPGLLARLGIAAPVPATRPAPVAAALPRFVQEGEYWSVGFGEATHRFKDSKGLQIVAYLVRNPGRDFHVLHLAGVAAGHEGSDTLIEEAAPSVADPSARAAYRERVDDLRDQLAEAEAHGDPGRAARARAELDQLAEELARGVGLGGRERRTGGSAERARVNIQRRISDALRKIDEAAPDLGRHLSRSIRTGSYCVYDG